MANQVQTASTINEIVSKTADALVTQSRVNKHITSGIIAANQRIDFVQTQIDELASLVQIGCIAYQKHVCITSLPFNNSRNESLRIGQYLAGNWSLEGEILLQEQLFQIAVLNNTRVQPITLGQFSDWLYSAFSFFKEWIGVGLFLVCCLGGCVLCFWLICRLKAQTSRDKKIILQAMIALESGRSAQTWLATLEKEERPFNVASESITTDLELPSIITHDSSGKTFLIPT